MQGDATLQRLIEEIAKRRNIGAEKTDSPCSNAVDKHLANGDVWSV